MTEREQRRPRGARIPAITDVRALGRVIDRKALARRIRLGERRIARSGARRRAAGATTAISRTRLLIDPPPRSMVETVALDSPAFAAACAIDSDRRSRRCRKLSPRCRPLPSPARVKSNAFMAASRMLTEPTPFSSLFSTCGSAPIRSASVRWDHPIDRRARFNSLIKI